MTDTGRVQQATQTSKEEVSQTAGQVKQAASDVTSTAVDQARNVTDEARRQVGSAFGDLQDRVRAEADGQVQRLSGTLRQWAQDLTGLADNAPGDSPARALVDQAAGGGHRAADYLDKSGVDGALQDLQQFARRRPGAFLGGAVAAGLLVGRLAKAGKKASQSGSTGGVRTGQGSTAPQSIEPPPQMPLPPSQGVPPAPVVPPTTPPVPPHPGV
ncbi:hypothetical protein ACFYQQ_19655 [Streptomyces sp. NPDC005496]|uniref:hypothetical protein n=1 Tax=unclassified Streptomyces TaxID=2593676 RepID=UPI0033A47036